MCDRPGSYREALWAGDDCSDRHPSHSLADLLGSGYIISTELVHSAYKLETIKFIAVIYSM